MRKMLRGLNLEIVGLHDLNMNIEIEESGKTPLENAKIKALAYYKASGIPTFSCDSGLYIDDLEEHRQPGVFVRRIGNKYLDDEAFIEYYSNLALEFGGEVRARFKNAISLVLDENNLYECDSNDIADNFILTSKVFKERKAGFPMDSIAIDIDTKTYFVESDINKNEENITKGFRDFFKRSIK